MARFYGTVQGNRGEAHRIGHKSGGLRVRAKTWDYTIVTQLYVDEHDVDCVDVSAVSVGASLCLYIGPIKALFDSEQRNVIVEAFAREALAKQAGETHD